jgi:hypothetical protein
MKTNRHPLLLTALWFLASAASAQQALDTTYRIELRSAEYMFAYIHLDPFQAKYVVDAISPTPLSDTDSKIYRNSELLAISRAGNHIQPYFSEAFEYKYSKSIDQIIDDKASRVVSTFTCELSSRRYYSFRHPCGSRFTKPTNKYQWPTLGGRITGRPLDLTSFADAAVNTRELQRAISDTGLAQVAQNWDGKPDLRLKPSDPNITLDVLVEESGLKQNFKVSRPLLLASGWAPPVSAKLVVQGDGNIWGRTSIPLSEVRRIQRKASPGTCPQFNVLLLDGSQRLFSRCIGSPFFAIVEGKSVELNELEGIAQLIVDGRPVGSSPLPRSFFLGSEDSESGFSASWQAQVSSFAILKPEESERLSRPSN